MRQYYASVKLMGVVSPAAMLLVIMPLRALSKRLNLNDSGKGFNWPCTNYATINSQHSTCVGCTTMALPSGRKCQWNPNAQTTSERCKEIYLGWVHGGYIADAQNCPVDAFPSWQERGGGQLHFVWWGSGGDQYLDAATASPKVLAAAVSDPSKVHYWYDPSYFQLETFLSENTGLFTSHALNAENVRNLAVVANLDADDVWNLVNNLKIKKGNGRACAKNFLSWLILHSFGGQFFDTTVQILKPDVNAAPTADELEAFKRALNEPVEHATFPYSRLYDRYNKGNKHNPTIFGTSDPWADQSGILNTFPIFHDQTSQYTLLGNPELYGKVVIQPSSTGEPMAVPDMLAPSVDVWAIKAPRHDEALRFVTAEFLARASHYGLVDGTEATTTFPTKLFGRDWDPGIRMDMSKAGDFQSALTSNAKTTIGNHFDVRAVCLKSLSMMSLHVGLTRASAVPNPSETLQHMWERHVIYPATDFNIGHPVVAEWRMIKYSGQTHVA